MPIRLSGLQSGMDTEALVSALVSSYSLQKDNLVKAQTKLSWKQESWKTMNTSIYSFFSGKLSSFRFSNNYNLKAATISNSVYAKVTAGSSAVNGTQTLEVNKLAATGYLTGGVVTGTDDSGNSAKITGSSKLGNIKGMEGITDGALTVTVDGKTTDIQVSSDMTVNQFVTKLKEAGLNASFDENNQRFFVSSATSGASHDFSLVANNDSGLTALQSMGLFTVNDADKAEYEKWAAYASDADALNELKESAYSKIKISYESRAKAYADKYNAAKSIVDAMDADDTWGGIDQAKASLSTQKSEFESKYAQYAKLGEDGSVVKDDNGKIQYDTDKLQEDGLLTEFNAESSKISALENNISVYEENAKIMSDNADYVTIGDDGKAVAASASDIDTSAYEKIAAEVDSENAVLKADSDAEIDAKVAYSQKMAALYSGGSLSDASGAVRIVGSDAEIVLNGATFESNTNNFSINGLTIQATALTGTEAVTITTDTDVDGIYNQIKEFFKEYNTLIKAMDTAYNADSSSGYEPLTSEEKEAMTDDEIEKWEKKIKDSLLRKDSTLGNTSSALKTIMASSIEIDGVKYSLASFGIKTQGYFDSGENEKGVYHIDGDADDSVSAASEDKLRAALASDPDTVISFFSQLATNVYNDLSSRMTSTSLRTIYTIYNDKQMATEYSEYTTKIADKEDEITRWEDYYYNKFSSMESALAQLNQTQSSLAGYFS